MDEKKLVSTNALHRASEVLRQKAPEYARKIEAKGEKEIPGSSGKTQEAMKATFAGFPSLEGARDTFCDAWPKVRTMINVALKVAAWIPGYGAQIGLVKGWMTAFNDEIVPELCGKK